MKTLKIAVGISGRVLFLEKFPDDEEHAGLNDFIPDIEYSIDVTEPPGLYMASFRFVTANSFLEPDEQYLDIDKLEPVS